MIIKNGLVWEESGSFRKKELVVDTTTHRIAETAEDDTVFDAEGLYVIPGLVDVHIHGARGHDFSDGNSKGLAEIAQYLHSCGVTSFCPTSMTLPEEQLTAAFATINDVPDAAGYAHIAGIHMEGPYLSPEKKGAQKASYLHAPDAAMFRRLSAASGNKIRIITIAPELPGSDAFIREFKDTVAISLGHSTASYEIAENAFAAGANHVTHLFNAMLRSHSDTPQHRMKSQKMPLPPVPTMSPICSTPCRHYTTAILALSARQRTVRMRWQRSSVTASTSTRRSSAMPSACLATTA